MLESNSATLLTFPSSASSIRLSIFTLYVKTKINDLSLFINPASGLAIQSFIVIIINKITPCYTVFNIILSQIWDCIYARLGCKIFFFNQQRILLFLSELIWHCKQKYLFNIIMNMQLSSCWWSCSCQKKARLKPDIKSRTEK